MAVNTYKQFEKRKGGTFFRWLDRFFQIDELYAQIIRIQFLSRIIFIAALSVLYIANRHSAEKKVRAINQLEVQVEDLRADFTTLKASYMLASKQSEVVKRAKRIGLTENKNVPIVISAE